MFNKLRDTILAFKFTRTFNPWNLIWVLFKVWSLIEFAYLQWNLVFWLLGLFKMLFLVELLWFQCNLYAIWLILYMGNISLACKFTRTYKYMKLNLGSFQILVLIEFVYLWWNIRYVSSWNVCFVECGNGLEDFKVSPYEEAMNALSSLITTRSRAEKSNSGDRFDLLFDYVKVIFCLFWSFIFIPIYF